VVFEVCALTVMLNVSNAARIVMNRMMRPMNFLILFLHAAS
jgi:hypothetical protein